jgi:hypothetical protein
MLENIWRIEKPEEYKAHFARWNNAHQPLDVFARNRYEWQEWQEYYPGRDDFNRRYIFSLAKFYHETDTWLFGGVFEVLGFKDGAYEVELTEQGAELIGRLKLRYAYRSRGTRVFLENHYSCLEVLEILREPYGGRAFPGMEDVDLSFEELELLVRNERSDWKNALENTKGVYLISDILTGKRYVGSAYGTAGLWGRWQEYVYSGHGGNVELCALAPDGGLDYFRQAFRFSLLEDRPARTSDEAVIARETHWKNILLTREHGLNRN